MSTRGQSIRTSATDKHNTHLQADVAKARRLLGYRPALRVRDGLVRVIGWYVAKLAPERSTDDRVPGSQVVLRGS